ncbi:MAG: uroporphyrinogen decarboxylase family protein [Candidatus Thorarchaeota archaeon]
MTSKDLTLDAIDGIPERVPFNPFIMHLAAAIDRIEYSNVYCQDASVLASQQIKISDTFGINHVCVSTDAYREASTWGVEVDFSGHTPIAKEHLSFEDFQSLELPDLVSAERIQDRVTAVRLLKEEVGSDQCVIGWIEAPFAEICCLFGLMNVLKLARRPDWNDIIRSAINRILPIQEEFAKMQIEVGADIIGAGDSAVSQIGPKRYGDVALESTQLLFKSIQKHVPVLYHVCGNSSVIDNDGRDMLQLVSHSKASILDIDYQVDIADAKQKIGAQICLRGNTNTAVLGSSTYSIEFIEKEILRTVQAGKPAGRYMYAAGCEWPWEPLDIAIRNLEIAKKLVEKHGVY